MTHPQHHHIGTTKLERAFSEQLLAVLQREPKPQFRANKPDALEKPHVQLWICGAGSTLERAIDQWRQMLDAAIEQQQATSQGRRWVYFRDKPDLRLRLLDPTPFGWLMLDLDYEYQVWSHIRLPGLLPVASEQELHNQRAADTLGVVDPGLWDDDGGQE